jgi:hypothetical protein
MTEVLLNPLDFSCTLAYFLLGYTMTAIKASCKHADVYIRYRRIFGLSDAFVIMSFPHSSKLEVLARSVVSAYCG